MLGGREELKFEALSRLTDIAAGDYDPISLLLTGPRGCGKTVMLAWMEKQAFSSSDLLVSILRRLRRNVFGLNRLNLYMNTNWEAMPGLFSGSAGASGGKEVNGAAVSITESLEALACRRRRLLVIVDEAHDLPAEVSGPWYEAFQLVSRRHPIMLVIAGTPDLTRVLGRADASFTERFNPHFSPIVMKNVKNEL